MKFARQGSRVRHSVGLSGSDGFREPAQAERFRPDKERASVIVSSEVEALVTLLPRKARIAMLGGEHAMAQVPSLTSQNEFLGRLITDSPPPSARGLFPQASREADGRQQNFLRGAAPKATS